MIFIVDLNRLNISKGASNKDVPACRGRGYHNGDPEESKLTRTIGHPQNLFN